MSLWQEFRDSLSSMISFPADYFAGWFGVAPAESGVEVNELTAMQIAAFMGCIRLISGAMGCTPLNVYERTSDGDKLALDHPLQQVLGQKPNREVTAADLMQTGQGHLLTTGNCYLEIASNGAGQPGELYLRSPYRTIPYRYVEGSINAMGMKPGELFYKTTDTPSGYERIIRASDMIHIKNFGIDSLVGLSPVKYYAREVLGSDLAAQSYSAKFFANSSAPNGYLKTAGMMKDEQKKAAIQSWLSAHSRGNAHRMAILDNGMTWEKVGVNPDEAQFIQTRGLNAKQIGTIFGVPMHFLGESEQSRANMEQRSIEFLLFTMKTWYVKWEQAINIKLFPSVGRNAGKYYAKFDVSEFQRATYADLLRGIQMGRFSGLYTVNEGRKLLGEQPYTKAQLDSDDPGDKLLRPVNMAYVTADDLAEPAPVPGKGGAGQGGNDQDGGDGGGKPGSSTTQGGKRSAQQRLDAEIKYYSSFFFPTFRDALGRLLARNKPGSKDFQRVFSPVMTQIAAAFSFHAGDPPDDMVLSDDTVRFVSELIDNLGSRSAEWTKEKADGIATEELKRALLALREHCVTALELKAAPPEDEEDEDDERWKPIVNVHVAPPVVNLSPEIHSHISLANRPDSRVVKAQRLEDGTLAYSVEESSQRRIKASRDAEGSMRFETEEIHAEK